MSCLLHSYIITCDNLNCPLDIRQRGAYCFYNLPQLRVHTFLVQRVAVHMRLLLRTLKAGGGNAPFSLETHATSNKCAHCTLKFVS